MRILHVNTYDSGGAFNAALRVHQDLLRIKADSRFLLLHNYSSVQIENSAVYIPPKKKQPGRIERTITELSNLITGFDPVKDFETRQQIQEKIKSREIEWFSFPDTGIDITDHTEYKNADIINLHWVAGFIDYSFFKKNKKPVVWTLHDMAPFTGGCHYSEGCELFLTNCKTCPQLRGTDDASISRRNLKYKRKNISSSQNLNIVTPSKWLLSQARQSKLFRNYMHHHIPNGVDSSTFIIHDKDIAREILGLPKDKTILLFVAFHNQNIKRKGFTFLQEAINTIKNESLFICSVGNAEPQTNLPKGIADLGLIKDEIKMSLIYSAADAFVIPSTEDNLPNTVLESLMCGTPVIGFSVGGIKDMITHNENGYLVDAVSSIALAETINLFLKKRNTFDSATIRKEAVDKYDLSVQSKSYSELYQRVINQF